MRVLSWNVWVGQSPEALRRWLLLLVALLWPHVIVLQEARRFTGTLPGYRRCAADRMTREDAGNCVILVRRGQRVERPRPLPVPEPEGRWVFRIPKPARVFYGVRVRGVDVIDVHRCVWGQVRNRQAWEAEDETLAAAGQGGHPMVMVGDWNHPAGHRAGMATPHQLAAELRAVMVAHSPKAIDYALVRGRRGRIRALGRKYGSDHAPKLLTLKRVRSS